MSNAVAAVMQWASLLQPASEAAGLDWRVVASIVYVESRGQPDVGDARRGVGLMGVVPGGLWMARELKIASLNIEAGIFWLRQSLSAMPDLRKALVMYHMGMAGAERAGWLESEDGAAYVAAIADAHALLFPGEPLPWEARPLRGEQGAREP